MSRAKNRSRFTPAKQRRWLLLKRFFEDNLLQARRIICKQLHVAILGWGLSASTAASADILSTPQLPDKSQARGWGTAQLIGQWAPCQRYRQMGKRYEWLRQPAGKLKASA